MSTSVDARLLYIFAPLHLFCAICSSFLAFVVVLWHLQLFFQFFAVVLWSSQTGFCVFGLVGCLFGWQTWVRPVGPNVSVGLVLFLEWGDSGADQTDGLRKASSSPWRYLTVKDTMNSQHGHGARPPAIHLLRSLSIYGH